jgi:hypothetical protein
VRSSFFRAGFLVRAAASKTCRALTLLVAVGLTACPGPKPVEPDAGEVDAGKPPKKDGGVVVIQPNNYAGVPCPEDSYSDLTFDLDGGELDAGEIPDGGVRYGICAALNKLSVTALLNGNPVTEPVELEFVSGNGFQGEYLRSPDALGRFDVRILRGRYDVLKYHPGGVFKSHQGFEEFGQLDMSKDQQRTLAVRSHVLRGSAMFASLPFKPQQFPPDVQFEAPGLPPSQTVTVTSSGGGYEVNLLEGTFGLYLSSPPLALGGTQLIRFPLTLGMTFNGPSIFDIDLKTREVEGEIRIDDQPLPNTAAGDDFFLEYTTQGGDEPAIITHHEGGVPGFHSLIPQGKYAVNLRFEGAPDRHLPSQIYNKQVAPSIDLSSSNQMMSKNFQTISIEGGILIDGKTIPPNPNGLFTLYMYGYATGAEAWSLLYYNLPLDSGVFNISAFPNLYYTMLNVDEQMGEELVTGWYLIDRYFDATKDTQLGINIQTSLWTGRMTIDGKPPVPNQPVGKLRFRNRFEGFYEKVLYTAEDGSFRVRIPKGAYEISLQIDRTVYPEYASGPQRILARLDLETDQHLDVDYETVFVTGPIRVAGEKVPDSISGEEITLNLRRQQDMREFVWGFDGGRTNYRMRIPKGDYHITFGINRDVWPDVAYGNSMMGTMVPAWPPGVTATDP